MIDDVFMIVFIYHEHMPFTLSILCAGTCKTISTFIEHKEKISFAHNLGQLLEKEKGGWVTYIETSAVTFRINR
jgi:hypothetical protein